MPLHVFLSQSLSLWTGGLDQWKIAKDVFIVGFAALATGALLIRAYKYRERWLIVILGVVAAYGLLHLAFLAFKDLDLESSLLATVYNNRLSMLLVIGLAAGLFTPKRYHKDLFWKVLVGTGTLVAILGLIQLALPSDLLENLGYSFERGARPFFGIDDKENLPRIMSTIRDPNTLGSYLIISVSLVYGLWLEAKKNKQRYWLIAALGLQLSALIVSFSRSAWLGAFLALTLIAWHAPRVRKYITIRNFSVGIFLSMIAFIALLPSIRDSYVWENIVFHSDENTSQFVLDSNQKHFEYMVEATGDIVAAPLGYGPGTAGIVSIRNERGVNLTENYYLQIGYEVGVIGLALFLALNVLVYREIRKTENNVYRSALLASFWGLMLTNLVLHVWTNEAVATAWWLSAGYYIGASRGS